MKEDRRLEVLCVAEPTRCVLDPLDLRVDPFGHSVGDRELQVILKVRQGKPDMVVTV